MTVDVLLAIAHFLLIFALIALLTLEMATIRTGMRAPAVLYVARLDMAYGASAGLLVAVGFARVFFGLKGSEFYLANPMFWTKIAAFVLVGALSLPPTLRIAAWRKAAANDPAFTPPEGEVGTVRRLIHAEGIVLFIIPVFAVLMARGIGT